MTISWGASDTATKYKLEEQKNGGSWVVLTDSNTNRSYPREALTNGSYKYRVNAYNTSGWDDEYRTSSSVTVLWPPSAPSSITVPTNTSTDGTFVISWGASNSATKYKLEEQKNGGSWEVLTDSNTNRSYLREELTNGSYKYRVSAYNTSGWDGTYQTSTSVTVLWPNSAPIITGTPSTNLIAKTHYSFTPNATDADGDPLTFTIVNKPSWASFNVGTGALTGSPSLGDVGSYNNITIKVSDNIKQVELTPFSIVVNTPPSTIRFIHTDLLGSPVAETDENGELK